MRIAGMIRRSEWALNTASHPSSRSPGMAYLFFCSLALLLRHLPRHRESIITIPIMATPSFMPSQMESNGSTSTSHNGFDATSFQMPNLPLNTSIISVSFGKRDGT